MNVQTMVVCAALIGCVGCGDNSSASDAGMGAMSDTGMTDAGPPQPTFTRHAVDTAIIGPAFAQAVDSNGDGSLELVVSSFGTTQVPRGAVTIYERTAGLDAWSKSSLLAPEEVVYYPNLPAMTDIDGDTDMDIVVPSGFLACMFVGEPCGRLAWYERTDQGWTAHEIVAAGSPLFYHRAVVVDFDGDGVRDLVTVGEEMVVPTGSRAVAQWFKGTADGIRFETTARLIGDGLGSLPEVRDIDGDGDLDVASGEYFTGRSFGWFERVAEPSDAVPAGEWAYHVIDESSGPAIMMQLVDDLYGDGVMRAVGANHTNTAKEPPDAQESAVFVFERPADPTMPWSKTQISEGILSQPARGQAAPGIFGVGDIDGDGDKDIAVSGDGDARVFWLEQTAPGQFTTHVLGEDLGQAGGMLVVDLNGDGKNEIVVSSYDQDALYIYERD